MSTTDVILTRAQRKNVAKKWANATHLAGWLALSQPYQVKPIRHKTLTNVTLQAGRYDVNHCCHINLEKNKKSNTPCGLAGTKSTQTHQKKLTKKWENEMHLAGWLAQPLLPGELPPTTPTDASCKKIGWKNRAWSWWNLFWEKKLWKVLFNSKRILILQKL